MVNGSGVDPRRERAGTYMELESASLCCVAKETTRSSQPAAESRRDSESNVKLESCDGRLGSSDGAAAAVLGSVGSVKLSSRGGPSDWLSSLSANEACLDGSVGSKLDVLSSPRLANEPCRDGRPPLANEPCCVVSFELEAPSLLRGAPLSAGGGAAACAKVAALLVAAPAGGAPRGAPRS